MRFVILGAGAVGGTIGGFLADSGRDVVLVARGEHARVLAADGLRLATPSRVIVVRPPVVEDVSELDLDPDDVLILTTKTQDTAGLLTDVAARPHAGEVTVVCAQNGVENERIALRLFSHVLGCAVMLPAVHLEPGRVDAQGTPYPGMLEIGRYPGGADPTADAVAEGLKAAGFLSTARPDVMRWKYTKLVLNTGNAVGALCGNDHDDEGERLVERVAQAARDEARRILDLAGIDSVGREEWAAHRSDQIEVGIVEGRPRGGGSSWQSVTRGVGSIETDALNGEIVLLARIHGAAAPVNEFLQRESAALARRRGRPGEMSPTQLVAGAGLA
jgi:2-dehydropantoate 2-reductase